MPFVQMKGLPAAEAKAESKKYIKLLHLGAKKYTKVDNLSGRAIDEMKVLIALLLPLLSQEERNGKSTWG